jgi:tetratricopeptide (TPR) repeat protein
LSGLDETQALEEAMHAASHMMNDDMEKAEEELSKGNSVFHKLGIGVASFMRATLGFEREAMRRATEKLSEAETAAFEHQRKAQRHQNPSQSSIYSPGTEFALCLAEVQIMGAVVGVLTESITEAIKGFYKLRKAYIALEAIMQEEKRNLESRSFEQNSMQSQDSSFVESSKTSSPEQPLDSESSQDEFFDAEEDRDESQRLPTYQGHIDSNIRQSLDGLTVTEQTERLDPLRRLTSTFQEGPEVDIFDGNLIDGFIHSGANMCFGMILILLSMMPPAFSALVKIAGFKGDRKRGLGLLWQASKFSNINGAFAGLILLGYYNGMLGFCDILPSSGTGAYPRERCRALLKNFRERYPQSRLWILEEARMLAREQKLDEAMKILEETSESNLKQVTALQWFEKALNYMYLHQYDECTEAFLRVTQLNNWSHGLYYYIAGSAQLELYREFKSKDPEKAQKYAEKAKELLKKVPQHIGKRRIMAKQLPLDVFINRKIQKWEQRAKDWNVSFVDAVGVSPVEEMSYVWNGYKRMCNNHLETSLSKLSWMESSSNPIWSKETNDEKAMLCVLKAAVLRNMDKTDESKALLQKQPLLLQWSDLKGGLKDNWPLPLAHYEMGVNYWQQYTSNDSEMDLNECLKWLEKVAAWESYDLDARQVAHFRIK